MTVLGVTMLVHDGPVARAYLGALRACDMEPARIVLMVSKRRPSTGKPIARWLPATMRMEVAERMQGLENNYWSRTIARDRPDVLDAIRLSCAQAFNTPADVYDAILDPGGFDGQARAVERVLVDGLGDPVLREALRSSDEWPIIFTGGGIVPASLLNSVERPLLHVHPGYLPDVRGADGLLWSMLVEKVPGASCFKMAPGIDQGDIVSARRFSAPHIVLPDPRLDDQMLYRALFSFVDPALRAACLSEVMRDFSDTGRLNQIQQDPSVGTTYNFMHNAVRSRALRTLFHTDGR